MSKQLTGAHESLIAYALSLPGAFEDHPWGERVAKVGKKVFVFFGKGDATCGLSVKLPVSGVKALDLPFTEPTGYGLGKSGWVSATFAANDRLPAELMREWILESYRAVAPKKLIKQLDGGAAATEPKQQPRAQQSSSATRSSATKPSSTTKSNATSSSSSAKRRSSTKPTARTNKPSSSKTKRRTSARA
jgi:predicted DNA-binding protein (MmcQ/YjbR family)